MISKRNKFNSDNIKLILPSTFDISGYLKDRKHTHRNTGKLQIQDFCLKRNHIGPCPTFVCLYIVYIELILQFYDWSWWVNDTECNVIKSKMSYFRIFHNEIPAFIKCPHSNALIVKKRGVPTPKPSISPSQSNTHKNRIWTIIETKV